jgi:hypothetical protein
LFVSNFVTVFYLHASPEDFLGKWGQAGQVNRCLGKIDAITLIIGDDLHLQTGQEVFVKHRIGNPGQKIVNGLSGLERQARPQHTFIGAAEAEIARPGFKNGIFYVGYH